MPPCVNGHRIVLILLRPQTEIDQQRRFLKPSEIEEFDSAWGMDPTGKPLMLLFLFSCLASYGCLWLNRLDCLVQELESK